MPMLFCWLPKSELTSSFCKEGRISAALAIHNWCIPYSCCASASKRPTNLEGLNLKCILTSCHLPQEGENPAPSPTGCSFEASIYLHRKNNQFPATSIGGRDWCCPAKSEKKECTAYLWLGHTSCKHRWFTGQSEWDVTPPHTPHSPSTSVPSRHVKLGKALGPNFPLTAALQDDEVILGCSKQKMYWCCGLWPRSTLQGFGGFFITLLLTGCFQSVLVYSGWSLIIYLSAITGLVPFSHNISPQHCISPVLFSCICWAKSAKRPDLLIDVQ